MPHIDEGTLHALLDGALPALGEAGALTDGLTVADVELHLRACADCRARLEAERDVRERAGLVLHDARLPAVDVPPFETLAPQALQPGGRRAWLPLAWAASVVLALGAGWWASEQFGGAAQDMALESVATGSQAVAARQDPDADAAAESVPLSEAPQQVAAVAAATQPAERSAGAAVARAEQGAPRTTDAPADRAAAATARPAAADTTVVAALPPSPPAPLAAAPPPPPPAPSGQVVQAGERQAFRVQHDAVQSAAVASAQLQAKQVPLGVPVLGAAPILLDSSPQRQLVQDVLVHAFRENVRRARAGEFEWLPLSPDDLRRSSTPALIVEGASTPLIDAAAGAVPGRLVRVRQRLDSGVDVELLLLRRPQAGADALAAPPGTPPVLMRRAAPAATPPFTVLYISTEALPHSEHEVVVHLAEPDVFVALRARMPGTELRALVEWLVAAR